MHQNSPPNPRPVYVFSKPGTIIDAEHNALKFQFPDQAERCIPLRYIARLLINENIDIKSEALAACARWGISIVVQTDTSNVLYRTIPGKPIDTSLRQRLMNFTLNSDWQAYFQIWLQSNHIRISRLLIKRLNIPQKQLLDSSIQDWVNSRASQLTNKAVAQKTNRALHIMALSWMQQTLKEYGIDGRNDAWLNDNVDLALEMSRLLHLQLQPLVIGTVRRQQGWAKRHQCKPRPLSHRQLARLFEKHRGRIDKTGQDLINRLHRWLIENA